MIAFIDDHRGAHGVEPICKVLPIAPSTYHAHVAKRRDPAKLSARARQDAALKIEVRRVFNENFSVYGARKVWRQLKREGFDGFGGQHMFREVANDRERGLDLLRMQSQRPIGHDPVTAAGRIGKPSRAADALSCEAAVQIRLDLLLKKTGTQQIPNVLPDEPVGLYLPDPLVHRVDALKPIVSSNDGDSIG